MPKCYYIYILTNRNRTVLYTGVTSNLAKRLNQHISGQAGSFTAQYNCHILIYFEKFDDPREAIAREKQLKGWRREKKMILILRANPHLEDIGSVL